MNKIIKIFLPTLCVVTLFSFTESCKKVFGLDLQQNVPHPTQTIDPRIHMTAWQLIKQRSSGQPDSIFSQMYNGILYSGIDTNEYTKPGRTYILLHNDAVIRFVKPGVIDSVTSYFGRYRKGPAPGNFGSKWTDYTPAQVKNWLLYLIIQGDYNYNFGNPINNPDLIALNASLDTAKTLLPPGTDPLNPQSIMTINLSNDRSSTVQLNNFIGSVLFTNARTAGYILTNGAAHVVDRLVYYQSNN